MSSAAAGDTRTSRPDEDESCLFDAARDAFIEAGACYTSSRNDLTTQGYPIEGDAVD
jgi:hypothetical protein